MDMTKTNAPAAWFRIMLVWTERVERWFSGTYDMKVMTHGGVSDGVVKVRAGDEAEAYDKDDQGGEENDVGAQGAHKVDS